MIATKSLASSWKEVPTLWIFEHYLDLPERLTGQNITIKSIFTVEKTPSMHIFYDSKYSVYKFKDFSSGRFGDAVDLVRYIFSLDGKAAVLKILHDYNLYQQSSIGMERKSVVPTQKFKIVDYTVRNWNHLDAEYWLSYKVNSRELQKYNVMPLGKFSMDRFNILTGKTEVMTITNQFSYGYFNSHGSLCKIYRPYSKLKFIKISDLIQGFDQLTYKVPYLIILSSLKDIMSFNSLGITNAEGVAPDNGESSFMPNWYIDHFKTRYKGIYTLFDNDSAGIHAKDRYKDKYEIEGAILKMEKDVSDSIKKYGIDRVRPTLMAELRKIIKKDELIKI